MNALLDWLDRRIGIATALTKTLNRPVPGGPSWRYVLPAAMVFCFLVEAITGVVMWMYYSPGAQSAWESSFWLQEMVHGGWLLRGIHFYTGHAMVALAGLYLVQLVVQGLYRAPREFVFWTALAVFVVLLAMLLTGDLLRWDQEGYWSTRVRAGFALLLPGIGSSAFKLVAGGLDFGNFTLTRFFALHAGACAAALVGLLLLQGWLLRRFGLGDCPNFRLGENGTVPFFREQGTVGPDGDRHIFRPGDVAEHGEVAPGRKMSQSPAYWPGQSLRNFAVCAVVAAVVLFLVLQNGLHGDHTGRLRGEYLGAPLGAPADPAETYAAARPEWAFLALYEFNHLFAQVFSSGGIFGSSIPWGIVPIFVIPGTLGCLLVLMPFIALRRRGHAFNVGLLAVLLCGAVVLSIVSVQTDASDPDHQEALAAGHVEADRARELAKAPTGIPPAGALALVRSDAKIRGPKLFIGAHCNSCHNCLDAEGRGIAAEKPTAPNLYGYTSRKWLLGLLNPKKINGPEYFGNTTLKKRQMISFVKETVKDFEQDQLDATVAALSAEAGLSSQRAVDARDATQIAEGRKAIGGESGCTDCHRYQGKGQWGIAPELTGYGTREWIAGIISNPAHARYYGPNNDRMPAYGESLRPQEIEILAQWLRGEWYEPGQ